MGSKRFLVAAVVFIMLFLPSVMLYVQAPAGTSFSRFGKMLLEKGCISDNDRIAFLELICCTSIALFFSGVAWNLSVENKLEETLLICLFFIVIFIPIFFGWGTDFALNDTENRIMATKPVYSETGAGEYPALMDTYLADHVPFRKIWLRMSGFIKYGVFNSSNRILSVPGKGGWIYYGGTGYTSGEDPIADYRKTNLFMEDELSELACSLQGFKNYLDSQHIEFRLMINLNKSHIYPEYLPNWMKEREGMSRAEQVIEYLKNHTDIKIVYPKEALMEAKTDYLLYVPTDAHWNSVGGYVGFVELMKSLDRSFVDVPIAEIDPVYYCDSQADVANIINAAWFTNNVWSNTSYKPKVDVEWVWNSPVYCFNETGNGQKILIYHDSFMNQMREYIAKEYSACEFVEKQFSIRETDIAEKAPNVVVFEILERMLNCYTSELSYWKKYSDVTL